MRGSNNFYSQNNVPEDDIYRNAKERANKDAADAWFERALEAGKEGDLQRGLNLLEKAVNLSLSSKFFFVTRFVIAVPEAQPFRTQILEHFFEEERFDNIGKDIPSSSHGPKKSTPGQKPMSQAKQSSTSSSTKSRPPPQSTSSSRANHNSNTQGFNNNYQSNGHAFTEDRPDSDSQRPGSGKRFRPPQGFQSGQDDVNEGRFHDFGNHSDFRGNFGSGSSASAPARYSLAEDVLWLLILPKKRTLEAWLAARFKRLQRRHAWAPVARAALVRLSEFMFPLWVRYLRLCISASLLFLSLLGLNRISEKLRARSLRRLRLCWVLVVPALLVKALLFWRAAPLLQVGSSAAATFTSRAWDCCVWQPSWWGSLLLFIVGAVPLLRGQFLKTFQSLYLVPPVLLFAGHRWWGMLALTLLALLHWVSEGPERAAVATLLVCRSVKGLPWQQAVPSVLAALAVWTWSVLALRPAPPPGEEKGKEKESAGGGRRAADEQPGRRNEGNPRQQGKGAASAPPPPPPPEVDVDEVTRVLRSKCWYDVLRVPRSCGAEELRRSRRVLSLATHPDKNKQEPRAVEAFRKITNAYDILSEPARRQRYDAELRAQQLRAKQAAEAEAEAEAAAARKRKAAAVIPNEIQMVCPTCAGIHMATLMPTPAAQGRYCGRCRAPHPVGDGEGWVWRDPGCLFFPEARCLMGLNRAVYDISDLARCAGLFYDSRTGLPVEANSHTPLFRMQTQPQPPTPPQSHSQAGRGAAAGYGYGDSSSSARQAKAGGPAYGREKQTHRGY